MEETIHNISASMKPLGWEPYVFAPYVRGKDNRGPFPYKVIRFQRPSSKRFGLRQLLLPLLWSQIKYRFQIVHCHGVYPPGYVGSAFHRITRVPLVITPHGGDVKTGDAGHVLPERILSRIKKSFRSSQAVTAISSSMKERIITFGGLPERIHVIPNGVNLRGADELKDEFREVDEPPYILFVGRLHRIKAVDVLLAAFSKINARHPEVKLKVAGDGKERADLQAQAERLGMKENVDFLGTVIGAEKQSLLKNALFFVTPRVINNIGVSNLEAMASGLPVIVSDTGDVSEIIADGENGLLVEPGDAQQLAEKMDLLLRDPVLRERIAVKALATVALYDWPAVTKQYIELYERLLK